MKSGFVAIVGRPNVGKSSILNAIIKEKVAIVSPKPQTTREKILGIYNEENIQIVFCDTPGIFKPRTKLDEFMKSEIKTATEGVEVVLVVLSATDNLTQADIDLIEKHAKKNKVVVAVNKMDLVNYDKVFPMLSELNNVNAEAVVPVSAKNKKNIEELKKVLTNLMPEGEKFFEGEEYTDKPLKFIVSETVREKALLLLAEEIPHGIYTVTTSFKDGKTVHIDVDIIVEKQNHKMIVIGKGGSMLKEIGTRARKSIENIIGKPVMLSLFVKVKEDWRNNNLSLDEFEFKNK